MKQLLFLMGSQVRRGVWWVSMGGWKGEHGWDSQVPEDGSMELPGVAGMRLDGHGWVDGRPLRDRWEDRSSLGGEQ